MEILTNAGKPMIPSLYLTTTTTTYFKRLYSKFYNIRTTNPK